VPPVSWPHTASQSAVSYQPTVDNPLPFLRVQVRPPLPPDGVLPHQHLHTPFSLCAQVRQSLKIPSLTSPLSLFAPRYARRFHLMVGTKLLGLSREEVDRDWDDETKERMAAATGHHRQAPAGVGAVGGRGQWPP
jgi:hypothetical protein